MEVVLLWLDDLDDVLFSVALAWERLRRVVLQIGLVASFALAGVGAVGDRDAVGRAFSTSPPRASAAWFLGAALRAFYYRESRRFLHGRLKKHGQPLT